VNRDPGRPARSLPSQELEGFLFTGAIERLPCGDGRTDHPANLAVFDWQGDGAINISDAVAGLQYLFSGGSPHARAVPGAERTACIAVAGCPQAVRCP
jgi:hypothetical protein